MGPTPLTPPPAKKDICVAYGATPPDPAEAFFNKKVAEDVASALATSGHPTSVLGLSSDDTRPIESDLVFNLCDGDEDDRFGMVSFARELEAKGKKYTGSPCSALERCKEKTLAWMSSVPVPRWWDYPPQDQPYIAKPRSAHGSLLITEKNINNSNDFPPEEYFFQELLEGKEFTACFLDNQFLGQCVVRGTGIVSRDDKWDESKIKAKPPKVWDHSGATYPQIRSVAESAWREMLALQPPGYTAYGRVDVRMDSSGIAYVIDMNPNAYLGHDGLVCSCWTSLGGDFSSLVRALSRSLFPAA